MDIDVHIRMMVARIVDVNVHFWSSPVFSQTVEYALRAVVYLAGTPNEPRTTDQIAARTLVPRAYLSKVLQGLRDAGLLQSQRGVGGGVLLRKAPEELTILEVVNAVEPIQRIRTCPLGLAAHGVHLCPLHHRLDSALAMVETAFGSTTLAEILAEPTRSIPLCPYPPTELASSPEEPPSTEKKARPRRSRQA